MLSEGGDGDMRLALLRKGTNAVDWSARRERARLCNRAARLVEKLRPEGRTEVKLSENAVMKHLQRRDPGLRSYRIFREGRERRAFARKWLGEDATEREIWNWTEVMLSASD